MAESSASFPDYSADGDANQQSRLDTVMKWILALAIDAAWSGHVSVTATGRAWQRCVIAASVTEPEGTATRGVG